MLWTTISIDSQRFTLEQDADVDALKAQARAAVKDGGGVLQFTASTSNVWALVPASATVLIEQVEVEDDQGDSAGEWQTSDYVDFDL